MLVTDISGKKVVRILCIHYLVWFKKGQKQVRALFYSGNKVNVMSPIFTQKLDFYIWKTNIRAQKIDGSALEIFRMVIANLEVEDKVGRPKFFQKIFLIADIKFKAILGMLFLKISNADVSFDKKTFMWKFYTTNEALPTTEQVQIVDPKEFVIAALDVDIEIFVVHMVIQEQEEIPMHSKKQAQIKAQIKAWSGVQNRVQVKAILFDKAPIEVPAEYSNYRDVFSIKNVAKLLENIGMNEHAIKIEKGKQLFFGLIYSLGPIELEILETYIKTNLANDFIRSSKFFAGAPILFDKKPDASLHLCVDF